MVTISSSLPHPAPSGIEALGPGRFPSPVGPAFFLQARYPALSAKLGKLGVGLRINRIRHEEISGEPAFAALPVF